MTQSITDLFIRKIWNLYEQPIPEHVYAQAKKCLLDYIGVTSSGAVLSKSRTNQYLSYMEEGDCSCIGLGRKAGMPEAAFINGFHAHVLELDDGHRFGMMHLGAPVISAVLSAAQKIDADENKLLKAIILGYEAAVRIAVSMQPEHKKRGYHTAGTCGTIGAAVAVSFILGNDIRRLKSAISAAGTSAAGLLEIQEDQSELKPYNTGKAAMSGLNAAVMATCDFCGPEDILAGERGVLNVLSKCANVGCLTEYHSYYEIERVYMKPYASCRHCHSPIEAALDLKEETRLSVEEIDSMTIRTYALAVKGHDHKRIQGAASAKLSIPYSVAAAYVTGGCGLDQFKDKWLQCEEIHALISKIDIQEEKEYTALSPGKRIADITLKDIYGNIFTSRVDYAKGDPENPMEHSEIVRKFMDLRSAVGFDEEKTIKIRDQFEQKEIDTSVLYTLL